MNARERLSSNGLLEFFFSFAEILNDLASRSIDPRARMIDRSSIFNGERSAPVIVGIMSARYCAQLAINRTARVNSRGILLI